MTVRNFMSGNDLGATHPSGSRVSTWRKVHVLIVGIIFTFCSTMGSSLPAGMRTPISQYFGVKSHNFLVLMSSLFMCGFAVGPLVFGPMSEFYGRRPVLLIAYLGYMGFTAGCALAPNYASLLTFRALGGLCAAAPNAITSGLYADVFQMPEQRGKAMAIFTFMTMLGPQLGPIVSGFASLVSWCWPFWIVFIILGIFLPLLGTLPETYSPILARKRDCNISGNSTNHFSQQHEQRNGFSVLTRPFVMATTEPILLFSSLYMALVYGILYLFFQSYPIIFQDLYGLPQGISGLAFIPLMIGSCIGFFTSLLYDLFHKRAVKSGKPWTAQEEFRRLPLAMVGAPLIVIALFWLAWLSRKSLNPILPMVAGIWFSWGFLLVFVAMLNYITDAYKENSASAHAAASSIRSIVAVCLPLATESIYSNLGIQWATSLLGLFAAFMAIIPFIFVRYGAELRAQSPLCRTLEGV